MLCQILSGTRIRINMCRLQQIAWPMPYPQRDQGVVGAYRPHVDVVCGHIRCFQHRRKERTGVFITHKWC